MENFETNQIQEKINGLNEKLKELKETSNTKEYLDLENEISTCNQWISYYNDEKKFKFAGILNIMQTYNSNFKPFEELDKYGDTEGSI